ncbi:Protein of unknown function DUF3755 [Macleaya cordata]|uniref:Uncharacterized protein n=1 Tax=Macleaya cordata TaxID=56857 RepID=A0A200QEM9_MACCD|nr:Protein of unknown function DUF3755 [Macleaya cordata]
MSADSNMGFHHDSVLASTLNQHAISFQSGATNSTSGMVSIGNAVSTAGMILTGNSGMINNTPGINPVGNTAGGFLLDSVPDLKHDTGVAVEWSTEEQSRLEQGLVKFADEPTIMRYIKIAATLRDKTVRDVALRCRWMTNERNGKRRKPEEHHMGRKMKDRKEMLMESKANVPRAPPLNMSAYSPVIQHVEHNDRISCEALGSTTRRLLDENAEFFSQIMTNLSTFKIQDNIDLFCRTRNNITAILNNMRDMPGIMSQMPPLPVSINQELANIILPSTAQAMMFNSPSRMHLMKQEPRC